MTFVLDYAYTGHDEPIQCALVDEPGPDPAGIIVVRVVDGTPWTDTVATLRRIAETLEEFGGYLPSELPKRAET